MLKQYATIFRRLMIFVDLCIVTGSYLIAYILRDFNDELYPLAYYFWILPVLLIAWGFSLYSFGMYSSFRLKRMPEIFLIILKAAFVSFIVFSSLNYIFRLEHVSRIFILLSFILASILILLEKMILIFIFRYLRKGGLNYRNILIVGTNQRAQKFIHQIDKHKEFGIKIVGLMDDDLHKVGETIAGYKVMGFLKDLPQILNENAIDHVFFIVPRTWLGKIEEPILYCETVGVTVNVAVDLFKLRFTKGKEGAMMGMPLLTFEPISDNAWLLLIKRFADIILSLIGLVLFMPVFLLTAAMIKWASKGKGPIFFRQVRCGLNGRKFTLYKFRTMVIDAEERKAALLAKNEMTGPAFKMANDPRVIPIGKYLRKFSIDELPQLWNVFRGDMSMVGPRPPLPDEVDEYDAWQRRRLSMRPGITCLWQISGRNGIIDFNQWMKLDLKYIDTWSLTLDTRVLLKTVPVVLLGIGAK